MKKALFILNIILTLTVNCALAQKNSSRNVIIFANWGHSFFTTNYRKQNTHKPE